MDEYRMTWSDAIRAEADGLGHPPARRPEGEREDLAVGPGRLSRERSFTWVLGLAAVRAADAQRLIANLHAAFRPLSTGTGAGHGAMTTSGD